MKTEIIKIGDAQGIVLSTHLLQQYSLEKEVEVIPKEEGILLQAIRPSLRSGWEQQFERAINDNHLPEGELLEGFSNEFDETEWT